MPFDGSGVFNRTDGTRTGATVWQQARDAGVKILASAADTHDEDLASGLEACVTRNGENTATANLPMGGFRHTNVGDASLRSHYLPVSQAQDMSIHYVGTSAGAGNTYTGSPTPGFGAYASGQLVIFVADKTNSGSATFNAGGLGALNMTILNGTTNLTGGEIRTGQFYMLLNRAGATWILLNPTQTTSPNNVAIRWRNNADSASSDILNLDTSDNTILTALSGKKGQLKESTNIVIEYQAGGIGLNGAADLASGTKVVFIANASALPSGTPTGGGVLYVDSGALRWKGSSGTITNLAPA